MKEKIVMTPEKFHLENASAIAGAARETAAMLDKKITAQRQADLLATVKKLKLPTAIIKSLKHNRNSNLFASISGVHIVLSMDSSNADSPAVKALNAEFSKAGKIRSFMCGETSPAGAKRFATFAKMKYGKNLDVATIKTAHADWIEFNTKCVC